MPIPAEIEHAFATGATILAASTRAARWLHREYALRERRNGRTAWTTPPIEDWDTWLRNQYLSNLNAPMLLTSLQERSVWTRMQREDASLLVSPASMAALAESAYNLLSEYEAHNERNHPWGKIDAESFRRWAANFDRECSRQNWLSPSHLESRIAATLNAENLPKEILLAGFDRITPAQTRLLQALEEYGTKIQSIASATPAQHQHWIKAASQREEITACAQWARDQIEKNPEARIGILTPDLAAMQGEIDRIFRRILAPQTDSIFAQETMPYEFSLGQSLANMPIIHAALLLLRWFAQPLREEEISWLLLSGFIANADYLSIARLDAHLRNAESLSLEITLQNYLSKAKTLRLTKLEAAQKSAVKISEEQATPSQWTEQIQKLLHIAGWPGTQNQNSQHFQILRRWERALDEIALLDFDNRRIRYSEFLSTLESHARETIFAPESQGAPIQIMGALEAGGQHFDAAWFLSVDDQSWPQRGRPHPLLPNDVQRRAKMPWSSAEADLELARAITTRIASSAPGVIFSHAQTNKDGELRPSPLLPKTAEWQSAPPTPIDHHQQTLEVVNDASGTIPWPQDQSPGGSEVLKHQAACAFQAFATKRLRAEPLNRSDRGLSAAERGSLLHKTLEKIWSPAEGALHTLEDLQTAIGKQQLQAILGEAIQSAFAKYNQVEDQWMQAYIESEKHRLYVRLDEWLRYEATRVPFEVIACEEELSGVNVGGLKLNLRADRIDQLPNYDRLLIDYKTGNVSPSDWNAPRPSDPQLPLYAVFGNVEDLRGILFARIRAGETCFAGSVSDVNTQLIANTKSNASLAKDPYTESMRDEWQAALLELAENFQRGEAAVNPKEGSKTCQFCPLPGLCRIAEARNPLEEEAEGAETND